MPRKPSQKRTLTHSDPPPSKRRKTEETSENTTVVTTPADISPANVTPEADPSPATDPTTEILDQENLVVDNANKVSNKASKKSGGGEGVSKTKKSRGTTKSTFDPKVDGKGPSLEGCWRKQIEVEEQMPTSAGWKVSVWNVNGLRAVLKNPKNEHDEEGDLLAYLKVEKPDIIFLNETKIDPSLEEWCVNTINDSLEASDLPTYTAKFAHSDKKGYAGVAALVSSKLSDQIEKVECGLGHPNHDEEGRCITVVFPKVVFVSTYVANAGQGLKRLKYRIQEFDKDLHAYLKKVRQEYDRPVIWCGDLNVAFEEIDIWNSKGNQKSAGHTPEERASFGGFLADGDWIDIWRHNNPNTRRYTFWPARSVQSRAENWGWRLDYFIASKDIVSHVKKCYMRDRFRGSDHCPIAIFLAS